MLIGKQISILGRRMESTSMHFHSFDLIYKKVVTKIEQVDNKKRNKRPI